MTGAIFILRCIAFSALTVVAAPFVVIGWTANRIARGLLAWREAVRP